MPWKFQWTACVDDSRVMGDISRLIHLGSSSFVEAPIKPLDSKTSNCSTVWLFNGQNYPTLTKLHPWGFYTHWNEHFSAEHAWLESVRTVSFRGSSFKTMVLTVQNKPRNHSRLLGCKLAPFVFCWGKCVAFVKNQSLSEVIFGILRLRHITVYIKLLGTIFEWWTWTRSNVQRKINNLA